MKPGLFLNVAGATATSAALLLSGRYATGWRPLVAILVVSAMLATTLNLMLRMRAREERMRMRGVAIRALRESEDVRARIARSLSDEATQNLAGALLNLKAARATMSEPAGDPLGDARSAIVATMERLEASSAALKPSVAGLVGVEAALVSCARVACRGKGIRLHATLGAVGPLADTPRDVLLRIAQDAIENVVEHSGASEMTLETGRDGGQALVVVRDNGIGFNPRAVLRRPGGAPGLSTMTELAAYWGGVVRVESRVGSGTRVEIRLPLEPAHADA